ncbi:GDSL esterase/lipase CPRD49 [Morus notabilis]|uniref:GDSL esterase/lipase CPRD49 n=1 Tax=Morus notabilis TaxID=981085 RepID=W9RLM5_9ROSA|nr:GDSL esterase/lipase CPRD49 [Morus notabilis]
MRRYVTFKWRCSLKMSKIEQTCMKEQRELRHVASNSAICRCIQAICRCLKAICRLICHMPLADIVLRGYSGWNSRRALQVLDQVFPKDAAVQPTLVIVYFGGNDSVKPHPSGLGQHVPLPEYVENMRKIAIHLKGLSEKTRIIFLTAPPINEDQIREICLSIFKFQLLDLIYGIHFTAEASKVVVKEILKVLKEKDWEPNLHYKSLPVEFGEDSPYYSVTSDGKTTLNKSESSIDRIIHWGIHDEKD